MFALPTGTVTFLFTDIEGSTRLWQSHPHQMKSSLEVHDNLLRDAIESNNGYVFKTVGDAFCGAFPTAMDGLNAALRAQQSIGAQVWDTRTPLKVRMALHTGEAVERNQDYYGPALNRTARLESIGYGGQILLSLVTTELVRDMLPDHVSLREMGRHRLKDLTRPEAVYQLLHPHLEEDFSPLKSLDRRPNNLPIQPTALIGRAELLHKICDTLTSGDTALVTLTGTGGIGKTRLALQIAAELIDIFEDGVYFVDLAYAYTVADFLSSIATVFRLKESEGRVLQEAVVDCLAQRSVLIVLDNLEQIDGVSAPVALILASCADVRILATSRQPLSLKGEHVMSVPPLPVPTVTDVASDDIKHIRQYESVRLFIERALAQDESFTINRENAPAISEICIQLDGIPLAIELASARMNILSAKQLLDRLSERFSLLTHGASDLPLRQQTLGATIDWSYELLDEQQKKAFLVLSVFHGGFGLGSAEQIFGEIGLRVDAIDAVTSLLDKSMLIRIEGDSSTPRFGMLETLRMYGVQRFGELPKREEILLAHAAYYCELAACYSTEIESENQAEITRLFTVEYENFRSGYQFLYEGSDPRCVHLLLSMWRFCRARGRYAEIRSDIDQVFKAGLELAVDAVSGLYLADGVLARCQGHFEESRGALQKGLLAIYKLGNVRIRNELLYELGWTYFRMNKLNLAKKLFVHCAKSSDSAGDSVGLGLANNGLGAVALRLGEIDRADSLLKKSIHIFSKTGRIRQHALALGNYGLVLRSRGKRDQAIDSLKSAVGLISNIDERDQIKVFLNNIAYIYEELGEHEEAMDYYQQLRKLAIETDDRVSLSNAHAGLCEYYLRNGDLELSRMHAESANRQVVSMQRSVELGTSLRLLAEVSFREGEISEARGLFSRSIKIFKEAQEPDELEQAIKGLARCE